MSRVLWPFQPLWPVTESLAWSTDIFSAKAREQRIALRASPRRIFNYSHMLGDGEYSGALGLVREAQSGDGFWLPDWSQAVAVSSLLSGSAVASGADLSNYEFGANALVWASEAAFEQVTLTGSDIDTLVGDYPSAKLIPLWPANLVGDFSGNRIGAGNNTCEVEFQLSESSDIAASTYSQYRSLDVLPTCPVLAGGLSESISWPSSSFDNVQAPTEFLRQRNYPDYTFSMRWIEVTQPAIYALREWLHSLRGRQKAFWSSSFSRDLTPADDVAGTTLTVFAFNSLSGTGHDSAFDIEILSTSGVSSYRRVTTTTAGAPVGGLATIDMTLDSSLTIAQADIERISYLRCSRLNADRVEFEHRGKAGVAVQVPCIEIPEP